MVKQIYKKGGLNMPRKTRSDKTVGNVKKPWACFQVLSGMKMAGIPGLTKNLEP
jgi:hypothetical protein